MPKNENRCEMPNKKKILMVTMQMEIGGAETHILELSRELMRRGYEVWIASNGGVYTRELEALGIRHVRIPLNTKRPDKVLKSYFALSRLIRRENFAIVHAHARIPAFLCGLLARRGSFAYITTAHWVFAVTPLWRKLTDWGQKSVAVSQDIKQYLIKEYGMQPDNISVTINGINTERFAPGVDFSGQLAEFGLRAGAPRIVCVSRMDSSRGQVPLLLAEEARTLCEKIPGLEIVLVGGSVLSGENDLTGQMRLLADRLNASLGRQALVLTGARTDIREWIAAADVFVGVSRAALEAMSEAKPVILAGNEGYLGIFGKENLAEAVETNFCCRGCESVKRDRLCRDIEALFSLSPAERESIGAYNRDVILRQYSAARMADDYICAYDSLVLPTRRSDVVISGYYGFENTGDDSLLAAMIALLRERKPDIGITVLSNRPRQTRKQYACRSVHRFFLPGVSRAMRRSSLLISGGGSLLQNSTSRQSLLYYLHIQKMAHRRGLKVMLYANGIGPLHGERDKKRTAEAISLCDAVTLREPASGEELLAMGLPADSFCITADPALTLSPCDENRLAFLLQQNGLRCKKLLAVSLRTCPGVDSEAFVREVSAAVSQFSRSHGLTPVLLPMQDSRDRAICAAVCSRCPGAVLLSHLSPKEIIALLRHCELAVGMRLHLLIYALNAGTPAVGLSYDPKIDAFLQYADMPPPLSARDCTAGRLTEKMEQIFCDRERLTDRAAETHAALREKAQEDAERAVSLLPKA